MPVQSNGKYGTPMTQQQRSIMRAHVALLDMMAQKAVWGWAEMLGLYILQQLNGKYGSYGLAGDGV